MKRDDLHQVAATTLRMQRMADSAHRHGLVREGALAAADLPSGPTMRRKNLERAAQAEARMVRALANLQGELDGLKALVDGIHREWLEDATR